MELRAAMLLSFHPRQVLILARKDVGISSHVGISSIRCVRLARDTIPRGRPLLDGKRPSSLDDVVLRKQVLESPVVCRDWSAAGSDVQQGMHALFILSSDQLRD